MERNLWVPAPNVKATETHKHCGNCARSLKYSSAKGKTYNDACLAEVRIDGDDVCVISTCSGNCNKYPVYKRIINV